MEPARPRAADTGAAVSAGAPGAAATDGQGTEAWHALDADRVIALLDADAERGLGVDDAARRLREYGPNRLPDEDRESAVVRLLKQFHNVLIYILIAAALFTAFLGEWIDTGVIAAVVLVNALIGYVQEGKAERAMEELRRMLSQTALVLRDGHRRELDAAELVPGDVVLLEAGDLVPADARVVVAREARVDEAALTGESEPAAKGADAVALDALLGDRTSMVYSGTLVTAGLARAIVVATGTETEVGRIGRMVAGVEKMKTPLLEKIERFGRRLSAAIVGLGALLFLFGWLLRGFEVEAMFLVVVSFAVAAIPEGLPAILTITLALGVQRMGRRNAIIRHLPAVETLGSVTAICSDKTGTLTRNELTAGRVLLHDGTLRLENRDAPPADAASGALRMFCEAAVLCNDADIEADGDGPGGDPLDTALIRLASRVGIDPSAVRQRHPRLDAIPFESANRYMATLHGAADGSQLICVKGAPERVLDMCDTVLAGADEAPLDPGSWHERIEEIAGEGHRMIAVAVQRRATGHAALDAHVVESGLALAGVVGLIDPPRPEAAQAVAECRRAGIRVVMITGDHALTAQSIAARLGIGDGATAVTGREIEAADDEELIEIAQQHDVIARASPEHKLRLVRALQSRCEVVAMTGDGVNDAPALKQADIGVAMGIKGTEAAKSAAEMVLADDNFASIERAVEEGRTVYDNLRKTILFILPTNGAEALMVLTAVAFALPELPITPVQILWVNMVTAVTLALAFAFEPTEHDIMERPPRPRAEPILSPHLVMRIAYVSILVAAACVVLFLLELAAGLEADRARTLAVNALVAAEVFYLFNCRSVWGSALRSGGLTGNRAAVGAVALLVPLQLAFTYAPFMQRWFGTAALAPIDWAWCLLVGVAVFAIVEAEKAFGRRR
jgi:calcium-translocating P-type ATPase